MYFYRTTLLRARPAPENTPFALVWTTKTPHSRSFGPRKHPIRALLALVWRSKTHRGAIESPTPGHKPQVVGSREPGLASRRAGEGEAGEPVKASLGAGQTWITWRTWIIRIRCSKKKASHDPDVHRDRDTARAVFLREDRLFVTMPLALSDKRILFLPARHDVLRPRFWDENQLILSDS
jgi:hypothetical protein